MDAYAEVGTSDTLTVTYPITNSGNTTAATRAGTAMVESIGNTTEKNGLQQQSVLFRWTAKPTFTVESA